MQAPGKAPMQAPHQAPHQAPGKLAQAGGYRTFSYQPAPAGDYRSFSYQPGAEPAATDYQSFSYQPAVDSYPGYSDWMPVSTSGQARSYRNATNKALGNVD
jgi:hypothetical protein